MGIRLVSSQTDTCERHGALRARIYLAYEHLTTSLELDVWFPQLPLILELSDSHLSPIKNWDTPTTFPFREFYHSECSQQYQHASLQVWAKFEAEVTNRNGQMTSFISADWALDVTRLVHDRLHITDSEVVNLHDGRILIGRRPGMSILQVLSPLSDSILGEHQVTVSENPVSLSKLSVQLVSGLTLGLRASTTHPSVLLATTKALTSLHSLKQLVITMHFDDGTSAPVTLYDHDYYRLVIRSLDEHVVSVDHDNMLPWPSIRTEGDRSPGAVKVELMPATVCQGPTLASTTLTLHILFAQDRQPGNTSVHSYSAVNNEPLEKFPDFAGSNSLHPIVNGSLTGPASRFPGRGGGGRFASQPPGRLSHLQIGMYTLLGVFCLAILMFVANYAAYALRYRHKRRRRRQQIGGELAHSHEWVCMKGGDVAGVVTQQMVAKEPTEPITKIHTATPTLYIPAAPQEQYGLEEPLQLRDAQSPTSQRKRVTFATFNTSGLSEIPTTCSYVNVANENASFILEMEAGLHDGPPMVN
uniref:Uncharacterized protein n=1 Tax=Eptatretus burgeri TaxID=7764 RepID=A0A8C4N1A2_EPTBU